MLVRQARLDDDGPPADIRVEAGHIGGIGAGLDPPSPGTLVVEAGGRVVLPGLIESHIHG